MDFRSPSDLTDLKSLSDEALLESTRVAAKNERHSTTIVLHHLLEVFDRRLFSPKYQSLQKYAVGDLKYTDGEAARRINAMWVLRAMPEIDEKIDSGSLNLTSLSQATVYFRAEAKVDGPLATEKKRELLSTLEDKSTRQVDRELLALATEPLALKKDRVRVVSDTLSELKCLVKDETLEDLKRLRGLLAHKHPNLSMGELLALVAKAALREMDPSKEPKRKSRKKSEPETLRTATPAPEVPPESRPSATPAPEVPSHPRNQARKLSRYIPAPIGREVWRQAEGKCQACGSVDRPEIDHIIPQALGGSNELENLRLLCFHCNQREADRRLGRRKMNSHRKQIQNSPVPGLAGGAAAQPHPR